MPLLFLPQFGPEGVFCAFLLLKGSPVPSRPLILSSPQVNKVFNIYTDGTGLKVVQLTGQKSFAKEQESLAEET